MQCQVIGHAAGKIGFIAWLEQAESIEKVREAGHKARTGSLGW